MLVRSSGSRVKTPTSRKSTSTCKQLKKSQRRHKSIKTTQSSLSFFDQNPLTIPLYSALDIDTSAKTVLQPHVQQRRNFKLKKTSLPLYSAVTSPHACSQSPQSPLYNSTTQLFSSSLLSQLSNSTVNPGHSTPLSSQSSSFSTLHTRQSFTPHLTSTHHKHFSTLTHKHHRSIIKQQAQTNSFTSSSAKSSHPTTTQDKDIFPSSPRIQSNLRSRIQSVLPHVHTALREYTTMIKHNQHLPSPPTHPQIAQKASISTTADGLRASPRYTMNKLLNSIHNSRKVANVHYKSHQKSHFHSTTSSHSKSTSSSTSQSTSHSSDPFNSSQQHSPPKLSTFQRILPKINSLSKTLQPILKKLSFYTKTGLIKFTKPFLTPIKSALTLLTHPLKNLAYKVADKMGAKFDKLLDLVDNQIARHESVPKDQITAIRTQVVAIVANLIVAVSKAVAAYFSNSGVMLAEALHSLADLSNQALLLFGTTKALKASDDVHPYGYATAKYIYGVLSASGVFFISCALTIYHAVAQFFDDSHAVEVTSLTVIVLGVSLIVEGYSQYAAVKSIRELADREKMSFFDYIRNGRETASIAVFVEDSVAIIGLTIAIVTTMLTHIYQNNIFDTIGTGAIGLAMGFVAYFLFHRNESYVLGTSFSNEEKLSIVSALKERESVTAVHDLKAVHYGQGDIRVKAEVVFDGTIIARQVLDESKLVPVVVPITDSADGQITTQHMLIGPDGTLAGHQLLYHLTQPAPITREEAQALLLRFGSECVTEVARETDQVEKHTRTLHPGITHLDLECHSSNPYDDFSSESFLYPYLHKFRSNNEKEQIEKDTVAQQKRARKSRAWSIAAKTSFYSLTQAMKGEHEQYQQQLSLHQQQQLGHHYYMPMSKAEQAVVINNHAKQQHARNLAQNAQQRAQQQLQQHAQQHAQQHVQQQRAHENAQKHHGAVDLTDISNLSTQSPHNQHQPQTHSTKHIPPITVASPTTISPSEIPQLSSQIKFPDLNQHTIPPSSALQGIEQLTQTNVLHRGRYIKPVHAKELVENAIYRDILNTYKQTMGEIDLSMTLFPIDSQQHAVLVGKSVENGSNSLNDSNLDNLAKNQPEVNIRA